jgi:hypothetical protein
MATKDKIERGFCLLWDSVDLSGDLVPGSVSGGGLVFDEVEMTGVSQSVRNYLAGHAASEIGARFHLNDTASTGSYPTLDDSVGSTATLTLRWGRSGTAPVGGDPEWEGTYLLSRCDIVLDGGRVLLDTMFQPGSTTAPAWGTV